MSQATATIAARILSVAIALCLQLQSGHADEPTGVAPRRLPPIPISEREQSRATFLSGIAWEQPDSIDEAVRPAAFSEQGRVAHHSAGRYQVRTVDSYSARQLANNFTAEPDFATGVVIVGDHAALKIGGYVKADLIHDFDAIGSTDSFDTSTIPTDGFPRENTRFHARQSRLSFDTRWQVEGDTVRTFVEADFFGGEPDGDSDFRLRHAYGTLGRFTAGQTWTTFTDSAAVPPTLDFEGAVSNVNRRQGLVRWDQPILDEGLSVAVALEDPQINVETASLNVGQGRTESPDFITRLRLERDWGAFQAACVLRELGLQPANERVISGTAWGFNFTGSILFLEGTEGYYQINFGEGIGSYRGSPDIVATGPNSISILPMFGWMLGVHHEWTDRLTSNFTFSKLSLDDVPGQDPQNLRRTTYLAVNLIGNTYDRVFTGVEYLYGVRDDISGARGTANRLQMSFGFYLP